METEKERVVDPRTGFSREQLEAAVRVVAEFKLVHRCSGDEAIGKVKETLVELDRLAYLKLRYILAEQKGIEKALWRGVPVKKLPRPAKVVKEKQTKTHKITLFTAEEAQQYADL